MVSSFKVARRLRQELGAMATVRSHKNKPIVVEYEWFDDDRVHACVNEWIAAQRGPQPPARNV